MAGTVSRRRVAALGAALAAVPLGARAQSADQEEANKAAVRRDVEEGLNGGNLDLIDELFSPEYDAVDPDDVDGLDALRQRRVDAREQIAGLFASFRHEIDDLIAEGDRVALRARLVVERRDGTGAEALELAVYEFADGLIVRVWGLLDDRALLGLP